MENNSNKDDLMVLKFINSDNCQCIDDLTEYLRQKNLKLKDTWKFFCLGKTKVHSTDIFKNDSEGKVLESLFNNIDFHSIGSIESYFEEHNLPIKINWVYYFAGKNKILSDKYLTNVENGIIDWYQGYLTETIFYWQEYLESESEEKKWIIFSLKEKICSEEYTIDNEINELNELYGEINSKIREYEILTAPPKQITDDEIDNLSDDDLEKIFLDDNKTKEIPYSESELKYFNEKKAEGIKEFEARVNREKQLKSEMPELLKKLEKIEKEGKDLEIKKRQIIKQINVSSKLVHEKFVQEGYYYVDKRIENNIEMLNRSAMDEVEDWNLTGYEDTYDDYCEACQESPCQCSDRGKTSTTYDF